MVNATGWTELMDGNLIGAAYNMYVYDLSIWVVPILFITYQIMLWRKTENMTLSFIMGLIFVSLYIGIQTPVMKPVAVPILGLMMVFQLAGILYFYIFK